MNTSVRNLTLTLVAIAAVLSAAQARAQVTSWNVNGDGSWNEYSNWSTYEIPTSGTVAFTGVRGYPNGPSTPVTVTLDGNQSAGALVFNVTNGNDYTLDPGTGGSLTVGSDSGGSIAVVNGNPNISAPVLMNGDLTVNITGGNSLNLAGGLGEAIADPPMLTLNGGGLLFLGAPSTYTGGTVVNSGYLVANNGATGSATGPGPVSLNSGACLSALALHTGTITGPVTAYAGASIAPGQASNFSGAATLNLTGGLTTNLNSTLVFSGTSNSIQATSLNNRPVFQGDVINLGGSGLNNDGGSISFAGGNPQTACYYRLFQNPGAILYNLNTFSLPSQSGWTYWLSSAVDPGYIDLTATTGVNDSIWIAPVKASWASPINWYNSTVPFGVGVNVVFPDIGANGPVTVTLDGMQVVSNLTFDVNTLNGYRLEAGMPKSGQSELLMDPANGMASIMDTGTNVIDVPVYVQGLSLEVDGGGMLDFGFNSQIIGSAAFIMNGMGGTTTFDGMGNYGGGTYVEQGTLMANNSGAIKDGTNLYVGSVPNSLFSGYGGVVPAQADGAHAVPEPGTLALLALGAVVAGLGAWRRRRGD